MIDGELLVSSAVDHKATPLPISLQMLQTHWICVNGQAHPRYLNVLVSVHIRWSFRAATPPSASFSTTGTSIWVALAGLVFLFSDRLWWLPHATAAGPRGREDVAHFVELTSIQSDYYLTPIITSHMLQMSTHVLIDWIILKFSFRFVSC